MPRRFEEPKDWADIRKSHREPYLTTRKYRVTGGHAIQGAAPGSVVELELTRDQADALILAGHIQEVHAPVPPVNEAADGAVENKGNKPLPKK
jgi:hypothetical protein